MCDQDKIHALKPGSPFCVLLHTGNHAQPGFLNGLWPSRLLTYTVDRREPTKVGWDTGSHILGVPAQRPSGTPLSETSGAKHLSKLPVNTHRQLQGTTDLHGCLDTSNIR